MTLLAGQVMWVATRPLPGFDGHDASGVEGAAHLPVLRLVVLGDSTCTGPGLDSPEDIWVRGLARRLSSQFQVDVRSLATGGSKAADVLRDQLGEAVRLRPDVALVSVGGNDALHGVRPRAFRRQLDEIVGGLCETSRLVVLSGVGDLGSIPRLPRPLADLARTRGREMNRIHFAVGAAHGAVVADQWRWSVKEFQHRPELFVGDQFHASPSGHAIWAELAYEALAPHIPQLLLSPDPES